MEDYALFMALKSKMPDQKWSDWPKELRCRKKPALQEACKALADEVFYHAFTQYLFFEQWRKLKAYCNDLGILLFGDMPIYVAEDSADAWANPDIFQLDRNRLPRRVAGVPPDYFSEDGQLWGNPLYRWTWLRFVHRYDWWIDRMRSMHAMYDLIRIDHFIGFANYWSVPYGAPNARNGKWVKGPGISLFNALNRSIPGLSIVAEDLGEVNDRVRALLKATGYPGMRVLTFGFGGGPENMHPPANLTKTRVVYPGTHDNDTTLSWLQHASQEDLESLRSFCSFSSPKEGVARLIETAFLSVSDTCVIPMQDVLMLGREARMNLPGTVGGNWLWRMRDDAFTPERIAWLRSLNQKSGRLIE